MAVFLIMDRDVNNIDPTVDLADCYKRGDIVAVYEDSVGIANPIAPPWYVVKVTGLTVAQALPYIESEDRYDPVEDRTARVVIRRCKWQVLVDTIPAGIRSQLQATRYVEVTWAQVRSYVRNKVTGLTE